MIARKATFRVQHVVEAEDKGDARLAAIAVAGTIHAATEM